MSNNKDFKVKNGLDVGGTIALGAIDTSISDTAVDVFVYDTSKDSDGGAWRKRTQATSWYNETLNTSTRGSRKEFPSVAVIVAESNQVTIYDGDDPSMPMWMVFPTYGILDWSTSTVSDISVAAMNGQVVVGTNDGGTVWKFMSDYVDIMYHGNYNISSDRTIAGRSDTTSFTSGGGNNIIIVHYNINDVAMTVLPNAPIDPATGLPIPTIAVATNGGVSVIKDDGGVVDKVPNSGNDEIRRVAFTKNHGLLVFTEYNANGHAGLLNYFPPELLFTTDTIYAAHQSSQNNTARIYAPSTTWGHNNTQLRLNHKDSDYHSGGMVAKGIDDFAIGGEVGVTQILSDESDTYSANFDSKGSVAYITSDYNTGHMVGDIKLAALSDTDDTDVVGSELLEQNYSNWTLTGATVDTSEFSSSPNSIKCVSNAQTAQSPTFSLVAGQRYTLTFKYKDPAAASNHNAEYYLFDGNATTLISHTWPSAYTTGWHTHTNTFTASVTGSTGYLKVFPDDSETIYFDDLSIRLADSDRSVNGNGLQIHGTIDKDPVATGADLVAYSGYTNSNYLQQPYNADLNFTGDFSISAWVNWDGSTNSFIVERGTTSSNNSGLGASYCFRMNSDGTLFFNHTPNGYSSSQYLYGSTVPTNTPVHVSVVRDGLTLSLYINGKLDSSSALTSVYDLTNTNAILNVGNNITASSSYMRGSLALLRISATAPSASQIAKIYEDERHLFTEDAKATLYGTSDAVTALAHDDDTNLLHVGTSAGRSVFQGLRRVDNTTDAVGTAISASNDLVVEE